MIFTQKCIDERRIRLQKELQTILTPGDAVIVFSGHPVVKPGGLDQTYPFLPHPMYYWLSGSRRHGSAVLFSLDEGWKDYQLPVAKAEVIWEGAILDPSQMKNTFNLFQDVQQKKFKRLFVLGQPSVEEKELATVFDSNLSDQVKMCFDRVRRKKDTEEIHLIKEAARIAQRGYQHLRRVIRPGLSERDLQIEYESEVFRSGAHQMPYDTIVGSGTNAAILHAIPTSKLINDGELILIDAGVDLNEYCVDITRVFAANGVWDSRQKEIIQIVQMAQTQSIQACRHGVQWSHIHHISARTIADGLKSLGLMKGSVDDLLESGAIGLFFPHGVGHMVGLRVRDVGYEENKNPVKHCGVFLRVDMEIQENHLLTVEPGCYFIRALLEDPEMKQKYKDQVNWTEVEKWMSFGGVRIEDNILITMADPINLTAGVEKAF